MDCQEVVIAPDRTEYFLQRYGEISRLKERYGFECVYSLNEDYVIAYTNGAEYEMKGTKVAFADVYGVVPRCFAITEQVPLQQNDMDGESALESMGILRLRRLSYFDLLGSGVLVGFVDTGIDYTNPVFCNTDGSSRIAAIWDQTAPKEEKAVDSGIFFGREYTQTQLTAALGSENPYALVPERDEVGHGTYVAGLAAGNVTKNSGNVEIPGNGFSGAAPLAQIMMVKVRPAGEYYRSLYLLPDGKEGYLETDLALGVEYLVRKAVEAGKPLVICMTMVTNSGAHEGKGILEEILDKYAGKANFCVVCSGGNETGYGLHYRSERVTGENEEVELKVGRHENGFIAELWGKMLNRFSVGVVSPTGEVAGRTVSSRNTYARMNFLFEETVIDLYYYTAESRTGSQLILMRINRPTEGIWRFVIYQDEYFADGFDVWLPVHEFVKEDTYFLRPDPDVTITEPGNAAGVITVAAYRATDSSIYLHSGRGFTRQNAVKPDIAAPGVGVIGPFLDNGFEEKNGTGAAAALTAGGCALIMEWAVTRGRRPQIRTGEIKRLLIGGAKRTGIVTPNREWGYGKVDFYRAFEVLRNTVLNS